MMIKVKEVWLTDNAVWIKTDKGEEASEQFADYPRLKYATPEQLQNYEVNEYGIHWKEIDEDLSFEGFFNKQPTQLGTNDLQGYDAERGYFYTKTGIEIDQHTVDYIEIID